MRIAFYQYSKMQQKAQQNVDQVCKKFMQLKITKKERRKGSQLVLWSLYNVLCTTN